MGVSLASCAPGSAWPSFSAAETLLILLFHLQSTGKHVCSLRARGYGDPSRSGSGTVDLYETPALCLFFSPFLTARHRLLQRVTVQTPLHRPAPPEPAAWSLGAGAGSDPQSSPCPGQPGRCGRAADRSAPSWQRCLALSPSPLPGAKPELVTQMRAGCCLIASRAPPSIATQTSSSPPEIQPGSPRLGERCAGYTDIKSTDFPLIIFLNICRC